MMKLVSGRYMATEMEYSASPSGLLRVAESFRIPDDIRAVAREYTRMGRLIEALCCYLVGQETDTASAPSAIENLGELETYLRFLRRQQEDDPQEAAYIDWRGITLSQFLENGARLYIDHAHPEYAAPLARGPYRALRYMKAGTWYIEILVKALRAALPEGQDVRVSTNLTDKNRNKWGHHENYLVERTNDFFEVLEQYWTAELVAGVLKTGSGVPVRSPSGEWGYVISQSATHTVNVIGGNSTSQRALINTRDEPHADAKRFRRLHHIFSDYNESEVQTYVKLGNHSVELEALVAKYRLHDLPRLKNPIRALGQINRDPTLTQTVELVDGEEVTALDILWIYHEWKRRYAESHELLPDQVHTIEEEEHILDDLGRDPMLCADRLDWVAKQQILEGYRDRDGLSWDDWRIWEKHLAFHDVVQETNLVRLLERKGKMRRVLTDEGIESAINAPPEESRAYLTGRTVKRFRSDQTKPIIPDWAELRLRPPRRSSGRPGEEERAVVAELKDPLAWTKDEVDPILASTKTPREFIEALRARSEGKK